MTFSHALMDFCLWCVAVLWLTSFIASHLRTKAPKRRRLGSPSIHCARWSTEDANILTRRQAE